MRNIFAVSSLLIILSACGSPAEMDCDQVFDLLTQEEGTVAGMMLGDSWAEVESKMKNDHKQMIAEYNSVLGTFTMDYGHDNRRFLIRCNLKNDIIQSIRIEIVDLKKNQEKIQKLHDRLVEHYTKEYPDEYTRQLGDFGDYGKWRVNNAEENLTIDSPYSIRKAPGSVKCHKIGIGLYKEI